MGAAFWAVGAWFGVLNAVPLNNQLPGSRSWLFLVVIVAAVLASAFVGKYVCLVAMCRFLSRANVGPLIAFGLRRRVVRFDKALIERFYAVRGQGLQARLLPPRPEDSVFRLHAAVYGAGALLSALAGFLPLMRCDHRHWLLAAVVGGLALIFWILAYHIQGHRES
jgi:nitrate reductase NapE component